MPYTPWPLAVYRGILKNIKEIILMEIETLTERKAINFDMIIYVFFILFIISSLVSISIAQISISLAAIAWLSSLYINGGINDVKTHLGIPFLLFILASILSIITSIDIGMSLMHFRKLIQIIIFFLFLNNLKGLKEVSILVKILIMVAGVMSLYGFFQAVQNGVSLSTRVEGTMSIYMTFAGLLMLVDLIAISRLVFNPVLKKEWWLPILIIIITFCLFLTLTRNAWIGLLIGVFIILFLKNKWLTLIIPLVIALLLAIFPLSISKRISSIIDPKDTTNSERLYMWESGLGIIRDYPLTGCGFGCVRKVFPKYKIPEAMKSHGSLHNNALQIAAYSGLIGLASWISIWVVYLLKTSSILSGIGMEEKEKRSIVVGSFAAVIGFLAAGLFEVNFYDSEVCMLLYFIMSIPFVIEGKIRPEGSIAYSRGESPLTIE